MYQHALHSAIIKQGRVPTCFTQCNDNTGACTNMVRLYTLLECGVPELDVDRRMCCEVRAESQARRLTINVITG